MSVTIADTVAYRRLSIVIPLFSARGRVVWQTKHVRCKHRCAPTSAPGALTPRELWPALTGRNGRHLWPEGTIEGVSRRA